MIVLRRQDSPEHDPQNNLTPTSRQFSARYAERSEPANRKDPSWACGSNIAGQLPNLQVLVWGWFPLNIGADGLPALLNSTARSVSKINKMFRLVRAIPWPSGRWRAARRMDAGHAGRIPSRECARRHVQPRCRVGGRVGPGKGYRLRHRKAAARRRRATPTKGAVTPPRSAPAHGGWGGRYDARAGGWDRPRATGRL